MDSGYLVFFWSCAMMPFLFVGCGPAVKPLPLPGPVKMRIIYHEEHYLLGRNERATDGVGEYVFQNVSEEAITIVLPPSSVLFLTDSGAEGCFFSGERVTARTKLAEKIWPEFLKQPVSFTLLPGDKRTFTSPFSMEIPSSGRRNEMSAICNSSSNEHMTRGWSRYLPERSPAKALGTTPERHPEIEIPLQERGFDLLSTHPLAVACPSVRSSVPLAAAFPPAAPRRPA